MKTYYKLVIDKELWHKFKVKCAKEDRTMLSVIIEKIKEYVNE